VCRDGIAGGPTPLFFNMPCRDNIESLLHQHLAPPPFAGAPLQHAPSRPLPPTHLPCTLTSRSSAFRAASAADVPDVDDIIKAQFCAAAAAAAAAAQSRGQFSLTSVSSIH